MFLVLVRFSNFLTFIENYIVGEAHFLKIPFSSRFSPTISKTIEQVTSSFSWVPIFEFFCSHCSVLSFLAIAVRFYSTNCVDYYLILSHV